MSDSNSAPKKMRTTRKYLGNAKSLAPRFLRLAQAIAAAPETGRHSEISHEECEALLEFYIDGERRGENVGKIYPAVFKHLKTCERCKWSYNLLADAPAQDAARDRASLSGPRVDLPFLVRATPDAPWSKRVRSPIGGGALGFAFTLSPRTVARAFASPLFAGPMERGKRKNALVGGILLLLDSVTLGNQNVDVELRIRSDEPDRAHIEISVVSSSPLPEPLSVNLDWNDKQYHTVIKEGRASIDDIQVSDLENAQVRVEFEAGSPSA